MTKPKETLREKIEKIVDYETDWASVDYYAPEGEEQYNRKDFVSEILNLISEEIKKSLPTHKGKMLSRAEVKKTIEDILK